LIPQEGAVNSTKVGNDDRLSAILGRKEGNGTELAQESPESLNEDLERARLDLKWVEEKIAQMKNTTNETFLNAKTKLQTEIQNIEGELSKRRRSGVMF
jgi:hypothetical protein